MLTVRIPNTCRAIGKYEDGERSGVAACAAGKHDSVAVVVRSHGLAWRSCSRSRAAAVKESVGGAAVGAARPRDQSVPLLPTQHWGMRKLRLSRLQVGWDQPEARVLQSRAKDGGALFRQSLQ